MHNVSVNSNWVHAPGQPPGISSKNCRGSEFDFSKLPGDREFDKGRDSAYEYLILASTPGKCLRSFRKDNNHLENFDTY